MLCFMVSTPVDQREMRLNTVQQFIHSIGFVSSLYWSMLTPRSMLNPLSILCGAGVIQIIRDLTAKVCAYCKAGTSHLPSTHLRGLITSIGHWNEASELKPWYCMASLTLEIVRLTVAICACIGVQQPKPRSPKQQQRRGAAQQPSDTARRIEPLDARTLQSIDALISSYDEHRIEMRAPNAVETSR